MLEKKAFKNLTIDESESVSITLNELGQINEEIGNLKNEIACQLAALHLYRRILRNAKIDYRVFEEHLKPEDIYVMTQNDMETMEEFIYLRIPANRDLILKAQNVDFPEIHV